MTASRILSQHGNVIATDFRPRPREEWAISISFKTETLFCDGHITLIRTTAYMEGKPLSVSHILGDLATGKSATL